MSSYEASRALVLPPTHFDFPALSLLCDWLEQRNLQGKGGAPDPHFLTWVMRTD